MPESAPPTHFLHALRHRDLLRAESNALRLLDGPGDGTEFAGLFIDDFAGRWLVGTIGAPPPEWLRRFAESGGPDAPRSIYWKTLDNKSKGGPLHWTGERVDAPFAIQENGLHYRVDFSAGYSQGIFLDQRDNRLAVRRMAGSGSATLNCFAYTCAFSVAAAAGGSRTVSVDLSKHYLDWGRENFALNGLDPAAAGAGHEFFAGDAHEVLKRFGRQGRRFDCIVLDPPTFSRNRDGKIFRVEVDFGGLITLAAPLLTAGGRLLCSTNQRSLSGAAFRRLIVAGLPSPAGPAGSGWQISFIPMPPDFTGEPYLQSCWVLRGNEGRG